MHLGSVGPDSGADTVYFQPEAVKERSYFITSCNDNVTIDEKPYAVQLLAADTAFFHFFNYPLKGKRMAAPEEALVTRQFAKRVWRKRPDRKDYGVFRRQTSHYLRHIG